MRQRRDTIAQSYGLTQKEYRNARMRWKLAMKRGHDVTLDLFCKNKRVQIVKGKPKKYHVIKRAINIAKAMPKWVDTEAILNIYMQCPKGYQVDHIIPIAGDNVSGLHVPWNLQYLSPLQNAKKSNKF